MDLSEALDQTHLLPDTEARKQVLSGQLEGFRRDFFGHVTNLQRIAVKEKADGGLSPELAAAKADAEEALDTLQATIEGTQAELAKLDPDTPKPPNRATRRSAERGKAK